MLNINYENGFLTIRIKEVNPESAHEGLLKGIVQSLKFQMEQETTASNSLKEGNVHLLQLLETMLPDERQLQKAFK